MARIRSVYPGLFVDDAFMEISMAARVVLIGIWVQCDDHGIFEWRPKSLKAAILPGDDGIAMNDLLGELVDQKHIKAFEVDGKAYGAVRNFCKYQHPKKPTYYYPVRKASLTDLPTWVGPYIAFGTPSLGEHSPTNSPKEKEEDKEKEEEKDNPKIKTESLERVPPAVSEAPPAAATLSPKAASQSRKGLAALGTPLPNDWIPDDPTCARVKTDFGMADEDLRTELPAFHALNVQGGVLSGDWTATFYLFCKRWKEHRDKHTAPRLELNRKAAEPSKQPEQFTEAEWDSVVGMYARTGRWSRHAGSDPMSPACLAPRATLEKHGINLETGERTIPPRKVAAS